jgi:hypothetical protein
MDVIQSKFASRTASLDEYYDQDRVLQKAKSILSRYEALKSELEAELEGDSGHIFSNQLQDLIATIDVMKAEVSSLSKTLKAMGKGLIPKTLEQFARRIRKHVQKYFENPRMVSHTKKLNYIRSDLNGAKGKKFFQTAINIKGYQFAILIVEPLDGNYTQNMPTSGNVFWEGKDLKTLEQWVLKSFKGTGKLSPDLDPKVKIWEGATVELKTEQKGRASEITGTSSGPSGTYHFKPGTVLKYTRMRSRGDYFLKIVKLNAGRENEYSVGDVLNIFSLFGTRERINGDVVSAIYESWGSVYTLRKHIKVLDSGQVGKSTNFDPGI